MMLKWCCLVGCCLVFFGQLKAQSAPTNGSTSDPQALALADRVLEALGGAKAWAQTRYLQWTFFGRRQHLWDKKTGMVRIEVLADSSLYLVDLNRETGKVKRHGRWETQPDSLKKYLGLAKAWWINDAYWMFMPYKLRDPGVQLRYQGQQPTSTNQMAEVLELTFKGVGRTPENRYLVFIDPQSALVLEWQYFAKFNDAKPSMVTPWLDWKPYGQILLSGNRGGNRQLQNIQVLQRVPANTFTE